MSVNNDNDQDLEALETLSLTDFPLTEDTDCGYQTNQHQGLASSATEDLFEFCSGDFGGLGGLYEEPKMSHAEDMISDGKLIPINDQPPPKTQNKTEKKKPIHRKRSESMRELKSTSNKTTVSQLVRNSHSLDCKKLSRNSRLTYEPTADMHRNSLSTKTSSSRWSDLLFGPIKGPPEMDLRDIRNRQSFQHSDRFSGKRVGDHRKTSWGVLGILSCKSSASVAVTMPLS